MNIINNLTIRKFNNNFNINFKKKKRLQNKII